MEDHALLTRKATSSVAVYQASKATFVNQVNPLLFIFYNDKNIIKKIFIRSGMHIDVPEWRYLLKWWPGQWAMHLQGWIHRKSLWYKLFYNYRLKKLLEIVSLYCNVCDTTEKNNTIFYNIYNNDLQLIAHYLAKMEDPVPLMLKETNSAIVYLDSKAMFVNLVRRFKKMKLFKWQNIFIT